MIFTEQNTDSRNAHCSAKIYLVLLKRHTKSNANLCAANKIQRHAHTGCMLFKTKITFTNTK